MKPLSERMTLYMDAGFPIIYIETFEEDTTLHKNAKLTWQNNSQLGPPQNPHITNCC